MNPTRLALCALLAACAPRTGDTASDGGADDTGGEAHAALPEGWWEALTDTGGCADAVFYARDPDGNLVLSVEVPGLASDAWDAGGTTGLSGSLPDPGIAVSLSRGTALPSPCDDAADPDSAVADAWQAVSGTITAEATPEAGDTGAAAKGAFPARGYLRLEDVGFASDTAPEATLPDIEISAFIGWLPG